MSDLRQTVAMLNIERYRRLLASETSEDRRVLLKTLLSEEEARLALFDQKDGGFERKGGPRDGT